MTANKLTLLSIGMAASLSGCMSLPSMDFLAPSNAVDIAQASPEIIDVGSLPAAAPSNNIDAFGAPLRANRFLNPSEARYKDSALRHNIADYVRNMAQELVANMEYVTERTPVAVTHFSLIDSDYKETNILGHQMAESFVHEFHKFRMPVVEYKATQFIRVTETGDFVMSRDFLDLNNSTPIQYVLTGTMTRHQGGMIVNAKMLGMESNVVVASAQMFIPRQVVDAVLPSKSDQPDNLVDGVAIIQGE